jgi:phosphoglucosamine mutase
MGVSPNGFNINAGCGATDTALLQKTVLENDADLGIALDGDADRLIMVDEKGQKVDGDQLMAIIGRAWKQAGQLQNNTLVATVMSNLGLERYFKGQGITLERTAVGDRYVVERMREGGFNVGGEQSGHMVFSDFMTTGDGLMAALQVLAVLRSEDKPMSALGNVFKPVPQILQNVKFTKGLKPLDDAHVQASIAKGQDLLSMDGRVLVRPSGTEPLIRVMAEGDDEVKIRQVVSDICHTIETVAKAG